MPEENEVILEARGLTKVFGSGESAVRAVDGVDLTVRRGEIALIMGPSGSGKTTLLTMVGGLLRPTSGSVIIQGLDITSLPESRLPDVRRKRVGFVFQTFNLLEALSAVENVVLASNVAGVTGRPARERAESLLVESGLGHRLHFRPSVLSGGEKQRVSIARALANAPLLILADEPTANLDSKHGHDVMVLLRDLARQERRSVVVVSHDHRIREIADRVLWLEDGRFKDLSRLATDPVCGMKVEEEGAPKVVFQSVTYYFCAPGCAWEFEQDPARFLDRA
jgi:putative ABC transport system ATP-binding protein